MSITRRCTRLALRGPSSSSRRGISFCYTLIVLAAMLTLGAVFIHIGLNSAKWAYSHYRQQQSLFLAESAIDRAIWMMETSQEGMDGINTALEVSDAEAAAGVTRTFESPAWQLASGSYQFTAVAPHSGIPGTIEIRAAGLSKTGLHEGVFAVVRPDIPSEEDAWNWVAASSFGYAMFSDHNLNVDGSPLILGSSGLYANGDIHFKGTSAEVHGSVAATGNIYGTCVQVPSDAGWYERETCPRVFMPALNMAAYEELATESYGSGGIVDFTNGHASAGTLEEPDIIFVDGTVKLRGSFTGAALIIATKGFKVTGNVDYGSPDATWAFITPGKFEITGTAQVHGGVFCHNATGDAQFIGHGTPNIFGCVVSDLITVTGDYCVEYDNNLLSLRNTPGGLFDTDPPIVEVLAWERD